MKAANLGRAAECLEEELVGGREREEVSRAYLLLSRDFLREYDNSRLDAINTRLFVAYKRGERKTQSKNTGLLPEAVEWFRRRSSDSGNVTKGVSNLDAPLKEMLRVYDREALDTYDDRLRRAKALSKESSKNAALKKASAEALNWLRNERLVQMAYGLEKLDRESESDKEILEEFDQRYDKLKPDEKLTVKELKKLIETKMSGKAPARAARESEDEH